MVRAAAFLSLVLLAAGAAGAGISGVPSVTDGDTLRLGAERIRLHGIDAPESAQSCRAGGKTWACGEAATRALRERIGRRLVECSERDRDRYGRIVAVCRVAGADVNAWMVSQGWAVAYRKYSTDYVSHETAAKAARRGLWRGDFVEPSRWRRGERTRGPGGEPCGRLPHQGEHQQEGHAHLPRAGRGVVREDAHRHGEGRAVVLHRGEGPRGGVAAGEAVT